MFGWIYNNGLFCYKIVVGNCVVLKIYKLKGCEFLICCNCVFCKVFFIFCKVWLVVRVRVLGEEIWGFFFKILNKGFNLVEGIFKKGLS